MIKWIQIAPGVFIIELSRPEPKVSEFFSKIDKLVQTLETLVATAPLKEK